MPVSAQNARPSHFRIEFRMHIENKVTELWQQPSSLTEVHSASIKAANGAPGNQLAAISAIDASSIHKNNYPIIE
tara:strand:+ start:862 stop:1086 length:225 start_codon:yes stop_codon:yes gene_type:complete